MSGYKKKLHRIIDHQHPLRESSVLKNILFNIK